MKKKYRYFMSGGFIPEDNHIFNRRDDIDKRLLIIDIPAPFVRDSEDEAKNIDSKYAYRFARKDKDVVILIYPGHDFKVETDDSGRRYINEWTEGNPFKWYTYKEFKALGGIISFQPKATMFRIEANSDDEDYIDKLEKAIKESEKIGIDWSDFEIDDVTFNDLFPGLEVGAMPIYIDDEAYYVEEKSA